jgi:hypothetical protein
MDAELLRRRASEVRAGKLSRDGVAICLNAAADEIQRLNEYVAVLEHAERVWAAPIEEVERECAAIGLDVAAIGAAAFKRVETWLTAEAEAAEEQLGR